MRYYFVDEAGDLTLFNKYRQIMLGKQGVSNLFMVGAACVDFPNTLIDDLEILRQHLLASPYFWGVPSFNPQRGKTAVSFHANADLPEVKYEVFKMLKKAEPQFYVAFRRKDRLIRQGEEVQKERKINGNMIYDELVAKLFQHIPSEPMQIIFAHRGTKKRKNALYDSLQGTVLEEFKIDVAMPSKAAGLQVVDYGLWALQRMLERDDSRYYRYMEQLFNVIIDVDNPKGESVFMGNTLPKEKIMPFTG